MANNHNQFSGSNSALSEFDEYVRQGEPAQRDKGYAWTTAIGLQAVDGLKPSEYLLQAARENIDGDITFDEVNARLESYYESRPTKINNDDRTEEADKVSARIAEILSEKTFSFSPAEYITIHKRLFKGIYKFAGKIRDYNISKAEWVLSGETVYYASAESIRPTLDYDFLQEKTFKYDGLSNEEIAMHIATFVSGLWQIHAFGEGNTRTTAVFTIKYLRTFGFAVTNDVFADNSWYFRNALVRANYNDLKNNIHASQEFLNRFFRNLLLGESTVLKNRELHVAFNDDANNKSNSKVQNTQILKSNNCTLDEKAVLDFLLKNPKATQVEIAAHIGKSERTVKTLTAKLQEKGLLKRENGKRNGVWITQ